MLSLIKILTRLGDRQHLVREKAYEELTQSNFDAEEAEVCINYITMMYNSQRWEDRFGAIRASVVLTKTSF
jgi:ATP sulfurylase